MINERSFVIQISINTLTYFIAIYQNRIICVWISVFYFFFVPFFLLGICARVVIDVEVPIVYFSHEMYAIAFVFVFLAPFSAEKQKIKQIKIDINYYCEKNETDF